jgi:zinc finger SWIM domain-containing protein 3
MNVSTFPVVEGVETLVNNIHESIVQHGQEGVVDYTPCLEMEFESEVAAYEFYNEYSRRIGFGIRREYGNKSRKDGILTSRRFTCFKAQHNHALQPPGYVHMIRSHRRSHASQVVVADESGLKQDFQEYVSKHDDGIDIIGYSAQEIKNYLPTKRMRSLMYGEVGALLMHFKRQSENPSFFYDFQMDVEEKITNIFWADAQMINDYEYFGDVITFDTTFKSNKDYRPLGVFVGLNNHKQMVI